MTNPYREALHDLLANEKIHASYATTRSSWFQSWQVSARIRDARMNEIQRHINSIEAHIARAEREANV